MMAMGLVLRVVTLPCGHERRVGRLVPLRFPCGSPAVRGQAPRGSKMHRRSYALNATQAQAFETGAGPE
jgi:hypothetical protein